MTQHWKTIVLMALNGAGADEKEADLQIRVITPMMEEYLAEQKKKLMEKIKNRIEMYDPAYSMEDVAVQEGLKEALKIIKKHD